MKRRARPPSTMPQICSKPPSRHFDGPANCSALKNRMLNIDSAFDEKALGFKSFTAFVKAVDGIELAQDDKSWTAFFQEDEAAPRPAPQSNRKATPDPQSD